MKLLNGEEDILTFLDNCALVTPLQSLKEARRFVPVESASALGAVEWALDNNAALVAAAKGLYERLCPGGQLRDEAIRRCTTSWSFQVLPRSVAELADDDDLSLVQGGPRESFLDVCE